MRHRRPQPRGRHRVPAVRPAHPHRRAVRPVRRACSPWSGLFDGEAEIAKADGIRINLWIGLAMLLLGLLFLLWVRLRPLHVERPATDEPDRGPPPRHWTPSGPGPAAAGSRRGTPAGPRAAPIPWPAASAAARARRPTRSAAWPSPTAVPSSWSPRSSPRPRSTCWRPTSSCGTSTAPTGPRCCRRWPASTRCWCAARPGSTPRRWPRADRLSVVARAGIGLDNVDVPAATARGVLVVNAPDVQHRQRRRARGRAAARGRPQRPGRGRRAAVRASGSGRKFTGVEVADKTVGVVGLGRIGVLVAQRLSAFGVRLLAYDPYVQPARAAQLGVRLVGAGGAARRERLRHHPPAEDAGDARPDRRPRAGAGQARGADRQRRPRRAGGRGRRWPTRSGPATSAAPGIDVFATEPTTDSPLFGLPGVVVTPHLGASTVEAQDKAGLAVARSVRLALQGEFVPDAVNVQAGGVGRGGGPARACRWRRSSAGSSPRSPAASRRASPSRCAARSPRTT